MVLVDWLKTCDYSELNKAVHGDLCYLLLQKVHFLNASIVLLGIRNLLINLFLGNGAIGNLSKTDLDEQEIYAQNEEQEKWQLFQN
jgi:hypothetical protein